MAIPLKPQENVFFPVPYVENEPNPLIITNERVVRFSDAGQEEVPARTITFVGRTTERPLMVPGILLAVVGVPLLLIGAYLVISVIGAAMPQIAAIAKPAEAPAAAPSDDPAGDDPAAAPAAAPSGPSDPGTTRIEGAVMVLTGLIVLGVAALLVTRRKHLVILRGSGNAMLRLQAKDAIEQMMILSTLQAVQSATKASGAVAPAPAAALPAAPKAEEVDDGGDPVKALQELAAARAAGKVKEEDFQARRDVLLKRVSKGS